MLKQSSDHQVRLEAVDPRNSFLVQAPAGSGKTELLTDRILALLATVNRPEEIVAITFTRKAASEMHNRVLAKLAAGAGPCPDEDYKRQSWELARQALQRNDELGWDLLQYPARLSIRTIDAFCSYLVRAMPWLSALGGMPGVAEQADAHYQAAARATLDMIDDQHAVAQLVEHLDVDVRQAVRMLAAMLGKRDQWLPLLGQGNDLDALVANLDLAVHDDLATLESMMPLGWADDLAAALRHAADTLAQEGDDSLQETLGDWEGASFGAGQDTVARWKALAGMLLRKDGGLRATVNKAQGFPPKSPYKDVIVNWLKSADPQAPWVAALHDVTHIPDDGYTGEQQNIVLVLIEVLMLAAAQLQLRFIEEGEIDFIEISQRALLALGDDDDPTDLLLTLDNVIRHILVDEFQDTSQTQIELLSSLTAGWMQGDGRTLFLVGDPMQSIYRFRKAEVGWFLHVKEHGLGSVRLKPLALTNNFRSQARLVHAVNRLCAPIFPARDHVGLGAIHYTPSEPFNDALDDAGLHFHPVWQPRLGRGDTADADYDAMADERVVMLARQALDKYPDSSNPVAILVRARSHLNQVVLRLAQAGVPCRAVDLVTLRSRQVVIDLVQLARALSHPADRLAWLSVLRSPLCGLSLNALHGLCAHDHQRSIPALLAQYLSGGLQVSDLDPVQTLHLQHAARVLLDSGNRSGTLPFAAWLEQCWNRLGGPAIYNNDSDRTDAESVLRLVEQLAPHGNLNPAELESRLDKLYAAPSTSGRAVDVMTIHKAKGLEFESVILVGLERRGQSDQAPLIRVEHSEGRLLLGPVKRSADDSADPISNYLAQREKKRAAYETDRLLYVALTRARSELHLVSMVTVDDGGQALAPVSSSPLARLWHLLDLPAAPSPDTLLTAAPANIGVSQQRYLQRPVLPDGLGMTPDAAPAGAEAPGMTAWMWRNRVHDERLLGIVAHAWLERIGRDGLDAWPLQRLVDHHHVFRRQLSRAGIDPAGIDRAVDILHETLSATLSSTRGQWLLRAAASYREWALLDLSGRVSVIDLAISQENDWLVVDYKTGVPDEGETLADYAQRMRTVYQPQLERYCEHVSALDGRPARAALFFPRVDLWVDCAM